MLRYTYEQAKAEIEETVSEGVDGILNLASDLTLQESQKIRQLVEIAVLKTENIVRSQQLDFIAGRCDAKHGDNTFKEFIEMGGDECPICMKRKLDALELKYQSALNELSMINNE